MKSCIKVIRYVIHCVHSTFLNVLFKTDCIHTNCIILSKLVSISTLH